MISDYIEKFWSYKPYGDSSPVAQTKDLFEELGEQDGSVSKAPISTL